jgi:hypothetical protein
MNMPSADEYCFTHWNFRDSMFFGPLGVITIYQYTFESLINIICFIILYEINAMIIITTYVYAYLRFYALPISKTNRDRKKLNDENWNKLS